MFARTAGLQESVLNFADAPILAGLKTECLEYAWLQVEVAASPTHATAIIYGCYHRHAVIANFNHAPIVFSWSPGKRHRNAC